MKKTKWILTLTWLLLLSMLLSGCLIQNVKKGSIAGKIVIREEILYPNSDEIITLKPSSDIPLGYVPLTGARVSVNGTTKATIVTADGSFLIEGLIEGKQTITVEAPQLSAPYQYNVEVLPNVISTLFLPVGKAYYLIIGASKYANLRSLNSADATAVEEFLVKGPSNVITVRDEDANKENILSLFQRIKNQLQPEDYLVVYFSGHGTQDLLALYNFSADDPNPDCLTDTELKDIFNSMPTKDITLIIDSCHAGSFFDGKVATRALQNSGYVVLASSTAEQNSYQYVNDGGLGFFTKHLLLGLINRSADNNQDRKITVQEIFNYTKYAMAREINSLNDNSLVQTPVLEDSQNRNPVIYRY